MHITNDQIQCNNMILLSFSMFPYSYLPPSLPNLHPPLPFLFQVRLCLVIPPSFPSCLLSSFTYPHVGPTWIYIMECVCVCVCLRVCVCLTLFSTSARAFLN